MNSWLSTTLSRGCRARSPIVRKFSASDLFAADHHGIAVVEAQPPQQPQAPVVEFGIEHAGSRTGIEVQNRLSERARVLEIQVDLIVDQRIEADEGAAQPELPLHRIDRGLPGAAPRSRQAGTTR